MLFKDLYSVAALLYRMNSDYIHVLLHGAGNAFNEAQVVYIHVV